MTTRSRLTATYVAIMLAGLLVLAAVAVLAIDRTLRASLDSRLTTEAKAAAVFTDVKNGRLAIDADDRRQFLTVLGVGSDGVILDPAGNVRLSSAARPLRFTARQQSGPEHFFNAGRGDAAVRAFAAPMVYEGKRVGEVIVWRSSEYIGETDRNSAIAFAGAALIIALLALAAANLVTRRALEDAFARQRRFTADASHELRAPLAVIRAEADLALRRERNPAEYQTAMQTIAGEADRMEALIGDLLSSARAESGSVTVQRVDAAAVVRSVSERLRPALVAKRGDVVVESHGSTYVRADPRELERAIMAVAHNAVQHVPERGRMRLRVQEDRSWCEIDVEDDGPGFSNEALEHAFERFWRESPDQQGSGLGLAIAKSIVESFGGRIVLGNRAGGGGLVRLRLPAWG